jgi:hypothetical protein
MIQVKMLITKRGQEKDQPVKTYESGKEYEIRDDSLADVFLANQWAAVKGAEEIVKTPVVEKTTAEVLTEKERPEVAETAEDLRGMKAKDLKQIVRKYTLDIDTQNVSATELSERIIKELGLKD